MHAMVKRLIGWDSIDYVRRQIIRHRVMSAIFRVLSILPLPLRLLLWLSGSDKHQPGQPAGHRYGNAYGDAFWPFKYWRVRLLEIGIGGYKGSLGGQSLIAWQGFFPFGSITAADIEDKTALSWGNVTVKVCDQSSRQQLAALGGPFDIIIDDGSHFSAHQILTFDALFDNLVPGGVYVVEDTQTSNWTHAPWDGADIKSPAFANTCIGYFLELTKYLNHAEFPPQNVDSAMLTLARQIDRISFEHNLILVFKR